MEFFASNLEVLLAFQTEQVHKKRRQITQGKEFTDGIIDRPQLLVVEKRTELLSKAGDS